MQLYPDVLRQLGSDYCVYVSPTGNDSTGMRGNSSLPFQTADAAIAAAQPFDLIRFTTGVFDSPTTEKYGVKYVGSGEPTYNSTTKPTALNGGTIFQGPWNVSLPQSWYNLGIDCGSDYTTAYLDGVPTDALVAYNTSPQSGFNIDSISTLLPQSNTPNYNIRFEGALDQICVFNISTFLGQFAFTGKCKNILLNGHTGNSHSYSGCEFKADAGYPVYNCRAFNLNYKNCGNAVSIESNGGEIRDINVDTLTSLTGNGATILGTSPITGTINLRNFNCQGANFAVDSATSNVEISNLVVDGVVTDSYNTGAIVVGAFTLASTLKNITGTGTGTWFLVLNGNARLVNVNGASSIYAKGYITAPSSADVVARSITGNIVYG